MRPTYVHQPAVRVNADCTCLEHSLTLTFPIVTSAVLYHSLAQQIFTVDRVEFSVAVSHCSKIADCGVLWFRTRFHMFHNLRMGGL